MTIYPLLPSRISPAATKPTTILGHDQLHPVNHLWLHKTTSTQGHRPSIWLNHPILMGFNRFASTACSHKVHRWSAAVPGRWLLSKATNWCSYAHAEVTSSTIKARGCTPSNPATKQVSPSCIPCLYILAQRVHQNSVNFFPEICSTYLVIFTPLDHFLRELSFFK